MAIVVPIISSFDSKGIDKAIKDFKKLQGSGERGAFSLMGITKAANTAGKNFAKFGAIGAGLAGVIGGSLVKAAYESQKVMKQTDAIIKATGGAAGLTGDQVGKLSQKLSLQAGVDDELIQKSLNLLLTFKKVHNEAGVGNDIFNRTAQAVLDMGNVFGSTDRAAIQLGKALSDPIKGITALKKSGIDFTEQQKQQIKVLVDSGKLLDAQKMILAEVESQVGGTAKATATGFDRMKVAIDNVQENLGDLLLPTIERLSNAIVDNVLPVLDQFKQIVGEQGIGAGINFLVGSVINAVNNMGAFGKVIIGVTTGILALNIATGIYKGTMTALTVATTLGSAAMKTLVEGIGAAKIAMATAGAITAVLVAAGIAYGVYSGRKAEAAKTTKDLTGALLAEKSAQSGLLVELYNSNKTARAFIDTQNALGLSNDDLAQYVNKGSGAASKFTEAFKKADQQANGIQPTLIRFRELLGLSADTSLVYVAKIRNLVIELEKMKGKQTDLNAVTALANKLAGITTTTTTTNTNNYTGLSKVIETAAQKFKKFSDAAQSVVSQQRNLRDSIKGVTDAQTGLTTATNSVISAQQNFANVTKGYGASSKQAAEAQKNLTAAQREATRAGFGLANAQQAVLDAQRKIADLTKAADPRNIQEAQDNLTEAQYRLTDAEQALVEARKTGKQRDIVEAEIAVREATNGVTDANTALAASQAAADPAVLTQAQQDLATAELDVKDAQDAQKTATENVTTAQGLLNEAISGAKEGTDAYQEALDKLKDAQKVEEEAIDSLRAAKEREIETTKTLVKANLLLQQSRKKLTTKQIKEANTLLNRLNTPVNVPAPTSTTSSSTPSFDFSGIDFSGVDFSGINIGGLATLASGGIVTKPTLALIGEGGESEAVIPLSKLGGMGGGDVYNITINSKIADQTLPDILVAELRKFNRRSGAINIQVA